MTTFDNLVGKVRALEYEMYRKVDKHDTENLKRKLFELERMLGFYEARVTELEKRITQLEMENGRT